MKPKTRPPKASSSRAAHAETSEDEAVAANGHNSDDDSVDILSIENHLKRLNGHFRKVREEATTLRKKNKELKDELDKARENAVENEAQPKRGKKTGPTTASLMKEIDKLKARIERCERTEKKDKKLIRQLQHKEIKKEADDLQDDAKETLDTDDSPYRLRRLLRTFSDIMSANCLEEDEECPICMETLEIDITVSFPCQHIVCERCFKRLTPNSDTVKCPQCRDEHAREEIETVRYTAATQWDDLLKVARKFSVMDHRATDDTGEEDNEENFLNDEDSEDASTVKSEQPAEEHLLSTTPEPEGATQSSDLPAGSSGNAPRTPKRRRLRVITPNGSEGDVKEEPEDSSGLVDVSYTQSPAAERRRKMEELAEARTRKRLRRL